jgi:hypothetical protein
MAKLVVCDYCEKKLHIRGEIVRVRVAHEMGELGPEGTKAVSEMGHIDLCAPCFKEMPREALGQVIRDNMRPSPKGGRANGTA